MRCNRMAAHMTLPYAMPWRTASISRAPVSVSTKSIGLIPLSAGAGALNHSATAASVEKIERANVWIRAIRTNFSEFSEESRTFFLRWSRMVRGDIPSFAASSSTGRDRTLAAASKDPAGNPTRMRSMAEVGGSLATWKAESGTRLPSGKNAAFSSKIAATCVRAHRALAVGSFCVFSPARRRGWHSTAYPNSGISPTGTSAEETDGSRRGNRAIGCRPNRSVASAGKSRNPSVAWSPSRRAHWPWAFSKRSWWFSNRPILVMFTSPLAPTRGRALQRYEIVGPHLAWGRFPLWRPTPWTARHEVGPYKETCFSWSGLIRVHSCPFVSIGG